MIYINLQTIVLPYTQLSTSKLPTSHSGHKTTLENSCSFKLHTCIYIMHSLKTV